MYDVNLTKYNKWINHLSESDHPIANQSGWQYLGTKEFERFMLEEYNLEVHCEPMAQILHVKMDDKNYAAFLLRWA